MQAFPSRRWLTLKRVNTHAQVRTSVRAKVGARPATAVAKARTPAKEREAAQPTEASRPNYSNQALAAHLGGRLGRFCEGGTAAVLSDEEWDGAEPGAGMHIATRAEVSKEPREERAESR
jgi:hypothetical protein